MPGIFIYGSCVSRDTRAYLGADWEVVEYVARQGMISATTPRGVLRGDMALTSKFQRQCLQNDIRSTLLETIDKSAAVSDVFVIDLVDERLGVYELEGGSYVTHSWELEESKLLQQQEKTPRHIPFGSDEHFELWSRAAKIVIAKINETGRPLVVLAPEWSETSDSDTAAPLSYRGHSIATYNQLYERYLDHLRGMGCNVVAIGQDTVKAKSTHQWGLAPYHYVDPVYHLMRDAITSSLE